jgi:hypothetical protein
MRQQHIITGLLLAGLSLVPVTSMQAAKPECVAGKPTAQSYEWNFKAEAAHLLQRVRKDALDARNQAGILEVKTEDPSGDWRFDIAQLSLIRDDVNDIGAAVCRLETIRHVVSPEEQQAIDSTVPLAQSMAGNAELAIHRLNHNQIDFWNPAYRTYARNMYIDAQKISTAIGHFKKHAKA